METTKKYNKSRIFRMAWSTYRAEDGFYSFGECLKEAWEIAKSDNAVDFSDYSTVDIFNQLDNHDFMYSNILEFISKNSKGFHKDIAEKGMKYNRLSEKQSWAIAYELKKIA